MHFRHGAYKSAACFSAALFFAAMAVAAPSDWELEGRYAYSTTQSSQLAGTASFERPFLPWLFGGAAARLTASPTDLDVFAYKGELRLQPFSFVGIRGRLAHSLGLLESTSATNLLMLLESHWFFGSGFGIYADIGWYERYTSFQSGALPYTVSTDLREGDFATSLGIIVSPSDRWLTSLGIGTFEEIDVYNLHNPFARIGISYRPIGKDWKVTAFARYRLLLGFGRLDELALGAGWCFDGGAGPPSSN